MDIKEEIKKQQNVLNDLQIQEKIILNIINKDKMEEKRLSDVLKELDKTISLKKNVLADYKKQENNFKENIFSLSQEIDSKNDELNSLNSKIVGLNKEIENGITGISELIENYAIQRQELSNDLKKLLVKTERDKKETLNAYNLFILETNAEKEDITEAIGISEREKALLENKNKELSENNNNLEQLNADLSKDNERLDNKKSETENVIDEFLKEQEILKKNVEEKLRQSKIAEDDLNKINNEIIGKNEELGKIIKKADYLIKKEDNLKNFEAYIIEVSAKLGLVYQPYE